jgi:hypothetical protein
VPLVCHFFRQIQPSEPQRQTASHVARPVFTSIDLDGPELLLSLTDRDEFDLGSDFIAVRPDADGPATAWPSGVELETGKSEAPETDAPNR